MVDELLRKIAAASSVARVRALYRSVRRRGVGMWARFTTLAGGDDASRAGGRLDHREQIHSEESVVAADLPHLAHYRGSIGIVEARGPVDCGVRGREGIVVRVVEHDASAPRFELRVEVRPGGSRAGLPFVSRADRVRTVLLGPTLDVGAASLASAQRCHDCDRHPRPCTRDSPSRGRTLAADSLGLSGWV